MVEGPTGAGHRQVAPLASPSQNRTERYLARTLFPLTIKTLACAAAIIAFILRNVSATLFAYHFIFSLTCHLRLVRCLLGRRLSIFLANPHRCTRLTATIPCLPCSLYHASLNPRTATLSYSPLTVQCITPLIASFHHYTVVSYSVLFQSRHILVSRIIRRVLERYAD